MIVPMGGRTIVCRATVGSTDSHQPNSDPFSRLTTSLGCAGPCGRLARRALLLGRRMAGSSTFTIVVLALPARASMLTPCGPRRPVSPACLAAPFRSHTLAAHPL